MPSEGFSGDEVSLVGSFGRFESEDLSQRHISDINFMVVGKWCFDFSICCNVPIDHTKIETFSLIYEGRGDKRRRMRGTYANEEISF